MVEIETECGLKMADPAADEDHKRSPFIMKMIKFITELVIHISTRMQPPQLQLCELLKQEMSLLSLKKICASIYLGATADNIFILQGIIQWQVSVRSNLDVCFVKFSKTGRRSTVESCVYDIDDLQLPWLLLHGWARNLCDLLKASITFFLPFAGPLEVPISHLCNFTWDQIVKIAALWVILFDINLPSNSLFYLVSLSVNWSVCGVNLPRNAICTTLSVVGPIGTKMVIIVPIT